MTEAQYGILIAVSIIMAFLAWFLFVALRKKNKVELLHRAQSLAEIKSLENERARIAAELHKEIAPIISALQEIFSTIDKNASKEQRETIEKTGEAVGFLLKRISDICNNLVPGILLNEGLVPALQQFLGGLQDSPKTQIVFNHDPLPQLSQDKTIQLYRVIMEIVNNGLKHANASRLTISLRTQNQRLILDAEDNGSGFDHQQKTKGLGLVSMVNRINILEGQISIHSRLGAGTKLHCSIPLP